MRRRRSAKRVFYTALLMRMHSPCALPRPLGHHLLCGVSFIAWSSPVLYASQEADPLSSCFISMKLEATSPFDVTLHMTLQIVRARSLFCFL